MQIKELVRKSQDANTPVILELGCGDRKRHKEAIGIDAIDYDDVDIVGDVFYVLDQIPDNSIDEIYSYHFIEHVENIDTLMTELARVVRVGGVIEFVAPHFSNPYFYSDPTHRSFFGLYTFCYLAHSSLFSRKVPTYNKNLLFEIERVDLRFKSSRAFVLRYGFKFLFGKLFNATNYLKELYEENFCYLFPCYEVKYRLRRVGE